MSFIYVTVWGLQFFPWLLPNLAVILSRSVLGFSVWPEAWGGELWILRPHLCAVWFDGCCGISETAWIMALPLHLWRKFPMPLCTSPPDQASLSVILRCLHQVTLYFPSMTFPTNAWPVAFGGGIRNCISWVDVAPGGPPLLVGPFHCAFQPACISKHLLSFQVFKRTSKKSAQ